jgi:hypothetical protein
MITGLLASFVCPLPFASSFTGPETDASNLLPGPPNSVRPLKTKQNNGLEQNHLRQVPCQSRNASMSGDQREGLQYSSRNRLAALSQLPYESRIHRSVGPAEQRLTVA